MTDAELARFYGWTPSEIDELSFEDYSKYHMAIRHLQAREMLDAFSASTMPYKKKEDQERVINNVKRSLFRDQPVSQMTTAEIFESLRAGNG